MHVLGIDAGGTKTMAFLADSEGRIVRVFYGAPKDLHEQLTRELAKLEGP